MVASQPLGGGADTLSRLIPYGGWLFALGLLIWIGTQFFGKFFQELATRFTTPFLRFFGSRVLSTRAIRSYRRALRRNYGEHALGFRKEGTVNVAQVYVPLQYVDNGQRKYVTEKISRSERTVVVGEAGAGKSLLMKHLLITWASADERRAQRTPVLVELHRCNANEKSLADLIFAEFERNGVRGRQSLVERALKEGQLFILFDGLDEVTRDDQGRVIQLIKDFVRMWEKCQYVTTCRIAVYTGQLASEFSSVITIADFDDAGIRRLLANWPGLDATEADRFFVGLTENPQLMRLAGSPLLLTMMIYLHTEVFAKTGRTLPGSRPAFYEIAINHLLGRDRELGRDDALSLFEGADKRAALQRIALVLQETPPEQPDRRSIDRIQLISILKKLAPDLNLHEHQVAPLIKEIVERSQLLVRLDGQSSRYIYRHSTLQEFLAATELRDDSARLLRCYRADRDGWRETVRLWCGVTSRDCADVVNEIFSGDNHDKVLALQCVAEATRISEDTAQNIINYFIDILASDTPTGAVEAALGTVASDYRPRGQSVFRRLQEQFLSGAPGYDGAARALAMTRLPSAARTLGERIAKDDNARNALRTMGEQAIQVLCDAAATGDLQSIDDLGAIGTASAAAALATLVWDESDMAFRAAWWIAALIGHREVEEGLHAWLSQPVTSAFVHVPILDWVWQPFGGDQRVATLMGRIALLLGKDAENHMPEQVDVIDRRIGVAVVVLDDADGLHASTTEEDRISDNNFWPRLWRLSRVRLSSFLRPPRWSRFVDEDEEAALAAFSRDVNNPALRDYLQKVGLPDHRQRVLLRTSAPVSHEIVVNLLGHTDNGVITRQWLDAMTPVKTWDVLRRIMIRATLTVSVAVVGMASYGAFAPLFGAQPVGPYWSIIVARVASGIFILGSLIALAESENSKGANRFVKFLANIGGNILDSFFDVGDGMLAGVVLYACGGALVLSSWLAIVSLWGLGLAIAVHVGVSVILTVGALLIWRRKQTARNPFRRILTTSEEELSSEVMPALPVTRQY